MNMDIYTFSTVILRELLAAAFLLCKHSQLARSLSSNFLLAVSDFLLLLTEILERKRR